MNAELADRLPSAVHVRAVALFFSMVAAAALWIALNFFFSGFTPMGDIRTAVARVLIQAAILIGLWLALIRANLRGTTRVVLWLVIALPFTLWLAVVWALAVNGACQPISGNGPLPIAVFAPVLVSLVLLLRSKRVAAVLDAAPPSWLVGVQVFRIFGGIFLVNWALGSLPGIFALPAGIGDTLVGVLALPVAFYLSTGTADGQTAGIAWNLLGLTDLAIAIILGTLTSPGRLHLLSLNQPNVLVGTYPTVMTPAFGVPLSIILHVLSLWQLRRVARKAHAGARSDQTSGAGLKTGAL